MQLNKIAITLAILPFICGCGGGGSSSNTSGQYTITDLGPVPNDTSSKLFINNSGQIAIPVATSQTNPPTQEAFLVSGSNRVDLGTVGPALGLNNSGQVVFYGQVYKNGALQDASITSGNGVFYAQAVNDNGQYAGTTNSFGVESVIETLATDVSGTITSLGLLPSYEEAVPAAFNNAQQIAGTAFSGQNPSPVFSPRAFLYSGGAFTDLGSLGGQTATAAAMNASGQIVGSSTTTSNQNSLHAYMYSAGKMKDLGVLITGGTSSANGINSSRSAIGYSTYSTSIGTTHAVLFGPNGPLDLNSKIPPLTSRWVLVDATSINDSGQIVGTGTLNGQIHGFLLTPPAS